MLLTAPRRQALIAVVAVLALAPAALAARKATNTSTPPAAEQRVVGLVLVAKDKPNQKLFNAVAQDLSNAPKSLTNLRLVTSGKLKKVLGKNPESAALSCNNDAKCLAKLGKKAQVENLVFAKVAAKGPNVSLLLLVVNVASGKTVELLTFSLASISDAHEAINSNLTRIFPNTTLGTPPSTGADSEELPLDLIMPTNDTPPPATVAAASPATETEDDGELPLELITGTKPTPTPERPTHAKPGAAPTAAPVATPDDEQELALAPLAPPPPSAKPTTTPIPPPAAPAPTSGPSWLSYAGIGCASVGILALGGAGWFGLQGRNAENALTSNTPQVKAKAQVDDANSNYGRARWLGGIGGALAVVGAAMVTLNAASGSAATPTPSISVIHEGAAAILTWRYE